MANDFVNTITLNNGTTYDLQDKRIVVTAEDVGKVVAVDSNGDLVLSELPEAGTKLYLVHYEYDTGAAKAEGALEAYALDFIKTDSNSFQALTVLKFIKRFWTDTGGHGWAVRSEEYQVLNSNIGGSYPNKVSSIVYLNNNNEIIKETNLFPISSTKETVTAL